jgi:hypothetical protein
MGVLSAVECELVRKFHCEGCQPEELRQGDRGPSAIALYRRIQRAVHRLRRIGVPSSLNANKTRKVLDSFIEAGWPAAQRLSYRLDEIFR